MTNISEEYKKLFKKSIPDSKLLVPLMVWCSGIEENIDNIQKINQKFQYGNQKIFIVELTYNTNIRNFVKYPKISKIDDHDETFLRDVAKYYGWSRRELDKNLSVIDLEALKKTVSLAFGYDKKQCRKLNIRRT